MSAHMCLQSTLPRRAITLNLYGLFILIYMMILIDTTVTVSLLLTSAPERGLGTVFKNEIQLSASSAMMSSHWLSFAVISSFPPLFMSFAIGAVAFTSSALKAPPWDTAAAMCVHVNASIRSPSSRAT